MNYFESFAVELSLLNEVTFQRLHYYSSFFCVMKEWVFFVCVCTFCFSFSMFSKRTVRQDGEEKSAFYLCIQRENSVSLNC